MSKAKKILIIEDEKTILKVLGIEFGKDEFDITCALDGTTGLKKVYQIKPDLIILDIILPGPLDGFEVLERLKKDSSTRHIPVIILSVLGSKEEIKKGLELGAQDYFVKTRYEIEEVVKKIKAYLKKS